MAKYRPEGLHANSIGGIVKNACRAAGYNPGQFAGHSLRAGLATQAAANGVSERLIMRQTRHRSLTTLRQPEEIYIRTLYTLFIATKEELPLIVSEECTHRGSSGHLGCSRTR